MKQTRKRLTYANVMSTIAVFLVLGGATAFAAQQLAKNSVGSKQLKKNAVTAAKIKKAAVTKAKIKDAAIDAAKLADGSVSNTKLADGSVSTAKLADGSVTGAKINAGSTSFSQIVARLRGTASIPFTPSTIYPLVNPNYTQAAGEDNELIGGLNVTFAPSCTAPRTTVAYLLVDAVNPAAPAISDIAGYGLIEDKGAGSVTRQLNFASLAGANSLTRFGPASATPHTVSIFLSSASCTAGSGIVASAGGVDVIGTK